MANYHSDTVSLISSESNKKIWEDITVGYFLIAIAFNYLADTIYIANYFSDGISIIDVVSLKK